MTSRHTLKTGIDARGQFFTGYTPGNNAGVFNYTSTYRQRTDDGLASVTPHFSRLTRTPAKQDPIPKPNRKLFEHNALPHAPT